MTVKQLLEILENVKYIHYYNGVLTCKEAHEICIFKEEDLNKTIKNFGFKTLPTELYYDCNQEENYTPFKVTVKELFKLLENRDILNEKANNIPMKIIVKTPRGKEIIYWHGVKVETYGKIKPWGWHKIQNLVVEEISEIIDNANYILTIIVRED